MKLNVKSMFDTIKNSTIKNAPAICVGVGLVGMGCSLVMAWNEAPKAQRIIKEESKEAKAEGREYKTIDKVKDTWKCWLPPVATFGVSTACIIFGQTISTKRNIALSAAATASERALDEFREKAVEKIGEKKVKEIDTEIAKDHAEVVASTDGEDITLTGFGNQLFFDVITDQFFRSNITKIKDIISDLNTSLLDDGLMGGVDFWDYCDQMNIKHVAGCDDLKWDLKGSARDSLIQLCASDLGKHPITGEAFTYIDFYNRPEHYCNVYN